MDEGEPLLDEAYDDFTIRKDYGVLYMGYPHVGKHLVELFLDNDVDIPQNKLYLQIYWLTIQYVI